MPGERSEILTPGFPHGEPELDVILTGLEFKQRPELSVNVHQFDLAPGAFGNRERDRDCLLG
jgi:hypothetical protein